MAELGYPDVRRAVHDALQDVRSDIGRLGSDLRAVAQQSGQHSIMITNLQHQMQQRNSIEQQVTVLKDHVLVLTAKVDQLNAQLQVLMNRFPHA